MDVFVTVNCADIQIKINLNDLLKLDYFKKMLNNCSTKMTSKEDKIIKNNVTWTIYTYEIPEITLDCSSKVLLTLIENHIYYIWSFNNKEFLLELMLYADMYMVPFRIRFNNGFDVKDHFWFVEYIKQELPNLNPFEIIRNGGFTYYQFFIEYGFKVLNENLIDAESPFPTGDLIDYLKDYINVKYDVFSPEPMMDVIKAIPILYNYDSEKVSKIINHESISKLIDNFTTHSKFYMDSHKYIDKYNLLINQLFSEFELLIGLIGNIDKNKYLII